MPSLLRLAAGIAGALAIFAAGLGVGHRLASRPESVTPRAARIAPAPTAAPSAPPLPALPAPAARPDQAPAPPPVVPSPVAAPAGEGGPVSREAIATAHDLRRSALEAAFASEVIDGAWSGDAERDLLEAAASEEASLAEQTPLAFRSQCRSRTCRVDATFPAEADADGWVSLFLLASAGTLSGADSMVTMREDGTFEVTIYGRRP